MPRRPPPDDDGPIASDLEKFGGVTQSCESCGTTLHDDVEICWKCGHALGTHPVKQVPMWVLITAGVLLAVFVLGMVLRAI
jgi:uncharacterized OB-fold protein